MSDASAFSRDLESALAVPLRQIASAFSVFTGMNIGEERGVPRRGELIRELPADQRRAFLQAAAGDRVVGGRMYDAHIVEIARLARAPMVVTDNVRHFAALRGRGVHVMSATQFAAAHFPSSTLKGPLRPETR